jgi:Ran GTPase-activating protein (RanGAP) involved in mRNA processing and transport
MVAAVAESPQLSQLESLHLNGHQLNPSAVARLADSPLAESLRVLRLSVCGLDADAMQMLADGRWPNLHRLDLPGNRFEEVGAIFLAGSDGFPVLRSLNLGNCKLGTAGGVRLLGAGWFAGLRELNLSRNGLSAAFALAFVEKPPRRLCRLNLSNNGFGFESAHVLCAADLPELTDLNLSHNKGGGNAAADGLSKSGRMETLLTLNMDNTGMSGGAIWRLADRPAPQFSRLSVSNNILGDGGARALAKAEWPVLRDLLIMTCNIGADGMSAIAEAPFFARLRQVGFYGNRLPTTGPAAQVFAQGYWITGSDPTWLNDAPGDDE